MAHVETELNQKNVFFLYLTMTGWLVPVSSVSLLALVGCRACGALCLTSLCVPSSQVLGKAVEALAFTWLKNETHTWQSHKDWDCLLCDLPPSGHWYLILKYLIKNKMFTTMVFTVNTALAKIQQYLSTYVTT